MDEIVQLCERLGTDRYGAQGHESSDERGSKRFYSPVLVMAEAVSNMQAG